MTARGRSGALELEAAAADSEQGAASEGGTETKRLPKLARLVLRTVLLQYFAYFLTILLTSLSLFGV